jgi:hypothetical protein
MGFNKMKVRKKKRMDDFFKKLIETLESETKTQFYTLSEVEKQAKNSAKLTRTLYNAYIKEGFTAQQAFDFTINIVTPKR